MHSPTNVLPHLMHTGARTPLAVGYQAGLHQRLEQQNVRDQGHYSRCSGENMLHQQAPTKSTVQARPNTAPVLPSKEQSWSPASTEAHKVSLSQPGRQRFCVTDATYYSEYMHQVSGHCFGTR
jgi:hypothetical protein